MTTISALVQAMIVTNFGVLFLFFCVKIFVKRWNGFDLLAVVALGVASASPYLGKFDLPLQSAVAAMIIGALAIGGGAPRRGYLFISTALLFSELITHYRRFAPEGLEDVDPCLPVQVGAAMHAALLCFVAYAITEVDQHSLRAGDTDAPTREMRIWITILLCVFTASGLFTAYTCGNSIVPQHTTNMFSFFKVTALAFACVAHGEEELLED
jgi:hypothetical protein